MKTLVIVSIAALLAAAGCATQNPSSAQTGASYGAVPAGASGNGLRNANATQNPYDQPGALPANTGGTDAGRVGTDPRYEPVVH
jgi:hypothetical protein